MKQPFLLRMSGTRLFKHRLHIFLYFLNFNRLLLPFKQNNTYLCSKFILPTWFFIFLSHMPFSSLTDILRFFTSFLFVHLVFRQRTNLTTYESLAREPILLLYSSQPIHSLYLISDNFSGFRVTLCLSSNIFSFRQHGCKNRFMGFMHFLCFHLSPLFHLSIWRKKLWVRLRISRFQV